MSPLSTLEGGGRYIHIDDLHIKVGDRARRHGEPHERFLPDFSFCLATIDPMGSGVHLRTQFVATKSWSERHVLYGGRANGCR